MIRSIGFDTDKYLKKQIQKLTQRQSKFQRLYLEFGGKLFHDTHATRVLPGYRPASKIELLKQMKNPELYYCVSANDIAKGKIRGDSGLSYYYQTLKDIKDIKNYGIPISGVVITLFSGQPAAEQLKRKLENQGYKVYFQNIIEGYPHDLEKVIEGYKKQPYIETKSKLVVITGAGGGSGKMALCLSQIYAEKNKKINSGYAKFETFPIWDLPKDHPINIAYEASTADLGDINEIDPYHLKEHKIKATNYNRDIENFTILEKILKKITGEKYPFGYKSPTDMGINTISSGITDIEICKKASLDEIIRRYFHYAVEKLEGKETQETIDRITKILKKTNLKPEDRIVVNPARKAQFDAPSTGKGLNNVYCGSAIELSDGRIVTGKNSSIFHSESAAILNALKILANIPDKIDLISPSILNEISKMKGMMLDPKSPSLPVNETLIVLASCADENPSAKAAMEKVGYLRNCEMHSTYVLFSGDAAGLRNLGVIATADAKLPSIEI